MLLPHILLFLPFLLQVSADHSNLHHDAIHPEAYGYVASQAVFAQDQSKRVAIVGAGASGSAAAFFLSRAARIAEQRAGLEPGELLGQIVVYEREERVGGRTTTVHPHNDASIRPVELGASIFVQANQNLVRAANLFNLTVIDADFGERGVGIWDGESFLFQTTTIKSRWSGWWDTVAALKRYGAVSPYRQRTAVRDLLKRFANLYNADWLAKRGAVGSIEEFAQTADLGNDLTTTNGEKWATETVGVNERWWSEIMEASTRVNYASDMDQIHALGAAVSLASGGARAIEGGNWRIFEGMLNASKADVRLGTEVTNIIPEDGGFRVETNGTSEVFDEVFYASPYRADRDAPAFTALEDPFEKLALPTYVKLYVTLLTTDQPTLDPSFFRLPPDYVLPTTILTTSHSAKERGVPLPPFQSITYHGETYPGSGEWVVKIFSLAPIDDYELNVIFGARPTWVRRKIFRSYPALRPTSSYPPVEPVKGLHYLAAMEPWVSTMETQTLSAREAVARVVNRWWGLGLGECKSGDAWDLTCV